MRIALVENELPLLEQLSGMIAKELSSIGDISHQIYTFTSGEDFLAKWRAGRYDLIILDIYMKEDGLLGIEVAHKIRETDQAVRLAFCTTSNEFASESYEVDAKFYLKKPITEDGIAKLFKRLDIESMELNRTVTLPNGHPVFLRKILYTEYSNHTVTLYFNDETTYRLRFSQKEMEELLLPQGYFCNPHKGLIVNFHAVKRINEEMLILINGEQLPISRRKLKDIKDAYTKFCFTKMRKEVGA